MIPRFKCRNLRPPSLVGVLFAPCLSFHDSVPHVHVQFGITDNRKDVQPGAHLPFVKQLERRYMGSGVGCCPYNSGEIQLPQLS